MASPVMQLKCYCNNYPTGDIGSKSIAARYASQTPGTDFKIDESKPYAEMWMGTYPVLPSYVLETGQDLQEVLDNNPNLVGEKFQKKFGHKNIPYIPKVLSIAKALSLQIHPDKELSARLHEKDPEKFTDPNHKPEIAVALSQFEAFCGWKPLEVIQNTFAAMPFLEKYLGSQSGGAPHFTNETLKRVTGAMLKDSEEGVKKVEEQIAATPKDKLGDLAYILDILPRLQDQHSATDPGSLVALLLMNYLNVPPTTSIWIPADCPHAYLKGDIIECMARSNNVLNTGFCPRADRDSIDIFQEALTFTPHSKDEALLPPKPFDGASGNGKTTIYAPPFSEFDTLRTALSSGESDKIRAIDGPSQTLTTKGSGKLKAAGKEFDLKEGYVFFVGAGTEIEYTSDSAQFETFTFISE